MVLLPLCMANHHQLSAQLHLPACWQHSRCAAALPAALMVSWFSAAMLCMAWRSSVRVSTDADLGKMMAWARELARMPVMMAMQREQAYMKAMSARSLLITTCGGGST